MEMVMSSTINKISKAVLEAQKAMGSIIKDSRNPFFKSTYATLNAVREACNPQLNANGVSILQPIIQKEGKSYVRTLLLHESGEYIGSDTEVICSKANDAQSYGSAISYARRYSLQALLGLAAEDDDGNDAVGKSAQETKPTEATTQSATANKPKGFAAYKKQTETKSEGGLF